MIKLHVLYGKPTDEAAFEEYYRNTHAPLVDKLPHLEKFEWGKAVANLSGGEIPYFWMATLTFADNDALGAAMSTPEGQATTDDVPKFATGGATIIMSEVN